MRILVTISSWVGAAKGDDNQAMRDTFLKAMPLGLDYRFFIGDGNPTGEDETAVYESFDWADIGYRRKALAGLYRASTIYTPKDDEIILPNVPDDFGHLSYKVRGQYRWALEHGYDYVFQIGSDVYVVLSRLMQSGFESYDYIGKSCAGYAGGGGYWISKRAMECVVAEPVTHWAEDLWVGLVLRNNGIQLTADSRYAVDYPVVPTQVNDVISSHLGIHNGLFGKYEPQLMRDVHKIFYSESDERKE